MKKIAQLREEDRRDLFSETAAKKGITQGATEKDFWLCWVLMIVFEHAELSKILKLKGGTSLSKCCNLTDRFSEDIDLILDWTVLTDENPDDKRSKTQQDKFNKELNQKAIEYIRNNLLLIIENAIKPFCKAEIDNSDSHTINIIYPKSFNYEYKYIKPEIKLEIGPLASMVPFNTNKVKSYSAEVFPGQFEQSEVEVFVITAERTFWEKVTILHSEANKSKSSQQSRYSRHYYDVFKMLDTDIETEALDNLNLLEDVVSFKQRFYQSAGSRYDLAVPKTIKLIPNDSKTVDLKRDYEEMREMIFGDYPEFDHILEKIEAFQNKLNNL